MSTISLPAQLRSTLAALVLFTSLLLIPSTALSQHAATKITEISEKNRLQSVKSTLQHNPKSIGVFVKGMICESCGIGIRKKLSKLKFVNRKAFKKGIKLNSQKQLTFVSIKTGVQPSYTQINKAIIAAGYQPVRFYSLNKGKIKSFSANSFR